ncbi:MAG: molybdopterin-dependent oxidoreductase [Thermacetogeniaceae bacterium]
MKAGGKKLALFLVASLVILAAAGAALAIYRQKVVATAAASASPDDAQQILVHGLQDGDWEITLGDLKKLPAVTRHAEATRSNGEEIRVDATGPLLDTLLKKYGKSQQEFDRVRFTARDNYSIAVPADILKSRSIILSYINDGKPLEADWQPIRVVIPGERAMYWVKDMIRIDLETGADRMPTRKLVFLDAASQNLPQEDYQYYDSTDRAIKTKDLLVKYGDGGSAQNVFIKAGDGLEKNETGANFMSAYIKITGQDAPKFLAPSLPEGMQIRDLLVVNYSATAFFDYAEGMRVLPRQTAGGRTGIALSEICKQTGLIGANDYMFTRSDGRSVLVATTDLGNGLVYKDANGALAFTSSGASGPIDVDDLLSIEPVT